VAASWLTLGRVPRTGGLVPLFLCLAAAAGAGILRTESRSSFPFRENVKVAGRVLSWEPTPYGPEVRLEVHRFEGAAVSPPLSIRVAGRESWSPAPASSWLRLEGRLEPERGPTNPGSRDREGAGRLRPPRGARPEWGPGPPPRLIAWRRALSERLGSRLPGFAGRLGRAVLLGKSRALEPGERTTFRRSGASHLVAVSGLHVGLVALLASLVLAPAPGWVRGAGVVGASWLYAGLAAWTPSAVRAAALALGAVLSGSLRRPRPASLGFALAIPWLFWAQPGLSRSLGFQLSAGAVAGILVAVDLAGPLAGTPLRALAGAVVVSLGAQLGTLPLQLAAFGAVAPFATLPNLIAIPLAGLFLPAALLAALLPEGIASTTMAGAATLLARAIQAVLELSARYLPYIEHLLPPHPATRWILVLLPLAWFTVPRPVRARRGPRAVALAAILLAGTLLFLPRSVAPGPWIAFLDVGQGDAAVLHLRGGTTWLIDTGDDRGPSDAARRAILPFLRSRGVRRIDGLVVSHRHRDHVGAMSSLLEGTEVEHVYDAGYGGTGGTSGVLDSLFASHRLWPCLVATGDTLFSADGASIVAVAPPRGDPLGSPPGHNLNDASLVVRVVDGAFRVLLAGDAEEMGERNCLRAGEDLEAEVLKVGHHGSDTSTHAPFLERVGPRWAIVSTGEGNRYGHPSPIVLRRLRDAGVEVLRTDREGAILVRLRGGRWHVRRHPPRRRWNRSRDGHPPSVVGTEAP